MRWPSGVQSGLLVRRRVGRQPAQRRASEIVRPHIRLGGQREPRAIGRHSDVAVRVQREAGQRRGTSLAIHRHDGLPATATGPTWDVDERAVGRHRDVSGARSGRHHALQHRRRRPDHLQPSEVECHGAQRPRDAVDEMPRRHVVRVAAATDEHFRRAGLQIEHRDLARYRCCR